MALAQTERDFDLPRNTGKNGQREVSTINLKELIFGKAASTVKVSQYHGSTQKWLPVADIQRGVIITKDGRFVKFMEVLPVNFYLLSPLEQQNIIHYFWSSLKVAPDTLQILVTTQRADIDS